MKRFIRIFFSVAAVVWLTGYFLGDLVLTEAPETLSWEEFSADPAAVACLREYHEFMGGSGRDPRQIYEQILVRDRARHGLAAASDLVGGDVAGFKQEWQRLYGLITPRCGPIARGPVYIGRWLVVPSEAVGIALVLAILVGSTIGLTVAISKLERTARETRP